jgi:hypothetical protein
MNRKKTFSEKTLSFQEYVNEVKNASSFQDIKSDEEWADLNYTERVKIYFAKNLFNLSRLFKK